MVFFFFSSRRRHTRCSRDWSSDVCSSDLFEESLCLPGRKVEEVRVNLAARSDSAISAEERIGLENQQVGLPAPARKSPPDFIRVRVHDHLLVIGDEVAALVQNESRVCGWDGRDWKSSLDLAYGHRDSRRVDDVSIEVTLRGPHELEPLGIQNAQAAGAAAHGTDGSGALECLVDRRYGQLQLDAQLRQRAAPHAQILCGDEEMAPDHLGSADHPVSLRRSANSRWNSPSLESLRGCCMRLPCGSK